MTPNVNLIKQRLSPELLTTKAYSSDNRDVRMTESKSENFQIGNTITLPDNPDFQLTETVLYIKCCRVKKK